MATTEQVRELKQIAEGISGYAKAKMFSKPEWGTLNFEDLSRVFPRLEYVATVFLENDLTLLPQTAVNDSLPLLRGIMQVLGNLRDFRVDQGSAATNRDNITQRFLDFTERLLVFVGPWLPLLVLYNRKPNKNEEEIAKAIAAWAEFRTGANDQNEKLRQEVQSVLNAIREASPIAAVTAHSREFHDMVDLYEARATNWLRATGVFVCLTLVAAFLFWANTEGGLDQGQVVQKVTTKLFALALLVTGTLWCGRNYKALKHLAVVNKHRELSIKTFEAFRNGTSDAQTQNAILLEATRAVFGTVPSGFVDGGNDNDLKVVEIARSVLPGKND